MAIRQLKVSDITGIDLDDADAVTVIVRSHPALTEPKTFDASNAEVTSIKNVGNLVELEVRGNDSTSRTVMVTAQEFAKLIPDEKLQGLPGVRGRRPGYSPARNGNGGGY